MNFDQVVRLANECECWLTAAHIHQVSGNSDAARRCQERAEMAAIAAQVVVLQDACERAGFGS